MFPELCLDPPIGKKFHFVILCRIRVTSPFRQTDGVEHLRRTVFPDTRLGQFPVIIHIFVETDVPNKSGGLAVAFRCLRHKRGLDCIQKLLRCPAVPMGHRSAVFGGDQAPFPGVCKNFLPEFAPIFQTPEQRAVIVSTGGVFCGFLIPFRVGNHIRECTLEQVIDPDPEHKEVKAFFQTPVQFFLPVRQVPLFCLKTGQAAVGEIAETAVLEVRSFQYINAGKRKCFRLWDAVAIPEIGAVAEPFKVIVNSVQDRPF